MYLAHINEAGEKQSLKEHSIHVAEKCSLFSVEPLKRIAYLIGLLHDFGKYQSAFQRRIRGENVRVEHSVCGAQLLREDHFDRGILGLMMEACIIGHHSGLTDFGTKADDEHETSFHARMKRSFEDISDWKNELHTEYIDATSKLDSSETVRFLIRDISENKEVQMEQFVDKMSFFTRYLYSCLVDADSLDTKAFSEENRVGSQLSANFAACLDRVDQKIKGFIPTTELQKMRSDIQKQVFDSVNQKADIYFIDMPTGDNAIMMTVQ